MAEEEKKEVTPPNPKDKKDMIEVEKSVLEQILENQRIGDEKAVQQAAEIERLTSAADIGRLNKYDEEHRGALIHTANVAVIEHEGKDRIVIGWKVIKDSVKLRNGILEEEQTSKYWLESDDPDNPIEIEMPQRQWYQEIERISGEIIESTSTPDGTATRTLRFEDGRELKLNIIFLNP